MRDYKKEYREYHGKPEQIKNRSERNTARRLLGLDKGDGKEVDHKIPLSNGGSNNKANLRAVSRTTNREKYNNPGGDKMPYKVKGKAVYHLKNGKWSKKQQCSSHENALKAMRLLHGVEHGMKPRGG